MSSDSRREYLKKKERRNLNWAKDEAISERTRMKAQVMKEHIMKKYTTNSNNSNPNNFAQRVNSKISHEDFAIIAQIGKGAFGEIYLAKKKDTGEIMALKKLKKKEMIARNQGLHVRAERDMLVDAAKLGLMELDFIVKLHCSFQDEEFLWLAMEYCGGGDLMNWLIKLEVFSEEQTRFYIAELIVAVIAIHSLGYMHRDLKPDNILLDARGHIKLSDFGLCKVIEKKEEVPQNEWTTKKHLYENRAGGDEGEEEVKCRLSLKSDEGFATLSRREKHAKWKEFATREMLYSTVGSPGYIAPEVLLKTGYRFEADWWSVGVILYEMLYGFPPFFSDTGVKMCQKIVRYKHFLEFPNDMDVSLEAIDLIKMFLCDREKRVGCLIDPEELKRHPFFKGIDWEKLREMEAPIRPNMASGLDTKHFDKFEEVKSPGETVVTKKKKVVEKTFNADNLLFTGFTFTREEGVQMKAKLKNNAALGGTTTEEKTVTEKKQN